MGGLEETVAQRLSEKPLGYENIRLRGRSSHRNEHDRSFIFYAFDPKHAKQNVRLKVVPLSRFTDADADWRAEADAFNALKHPAFLHSFTPVPLGTDYMVLPSVMPAGAVPSNHVVLHPQSAKEVILEVAKAMLLIHEKGVYHLDIKPSNLLVHLSQTEPGLLERAGIRNRHWLTEEEVEKIGAGMQYAGDVIITDYESTQSHGRTIRRFTHGYVHPQFSARGEAVALPATDAAALITTAIELLTPTRSAHRQPFASLVHRKERYHQEDPTQSALSMEDIIYDLETKPRRDAIKFLASGAAITSAAWAKPIMHLREELEAQKYMRTVEAAKANSEPTEETMRRYTIAFTERIKQNMSMYPSDPQEEVPTVLYPDKKPNTQFAHGYQSGCITELHYAAAAFDEDILPAARASAQRQLYWLPQGFKLGEEMNRHVVGLLAAYKQERGNLDEHERAELLQAVLKAAHFTCTTAKNIGPFTNLVFYRPFENLVDAPLVVADDARVIDGLLAAEEARHIAKEDGVHIPSHLLSDVYIPTAAQYCETMKLLVQDGRAHTSISLRQNPPNPSPYVYSMSQARVAGALWKVGAATDNSEYKALSRRLLSPLLADPTSREFHTKESHYDTGGLAHAFLVARMQNVPLQECWKLFATLEKHIKGKEEKYLLGGGCPERNDALCGINTPSMDRDIFFAVASNFI